jgi:hypothetical protein
MSEPPRPPAPPEPAQRTATAPVAAAVETTVEPDGAFKSLFKKLLPDTKK